MFRLRYQTAALLTFGLLVAGGLGGYFLARSRPPNAGIADAVDLSWPIAAVLHGWAAPAILDAYEAERRPITEQVSRFAMDIALNNNKQRRETPADIEHPGPAGEAVRARVGKEAYDFHVQQYCCAGLNFG